MLEIDQNILSMEKFDRETITYFKYAIAIYDLIEEKEIVIYPQDEGNNFPHALSKLDKRIISLFAAGLFSNTLASDIFQKYDLNKEDMLKYLHIFESDIKAHARMEDKDAIRCYNSIYKSELFRIFSNCLDNYKINSINDTTIIAIVCKAHSTGTKILDYYLASVGSEHIIYDAMMSESLLKEYAIVQEREKFKFDIHHFPLADTPMGYIHKPVNDQKPSKESKNNNPNVITKINIKELKSKENMTLLRNLQKMFVGQEQAARTILLHILNNKYIYQTNNPLAQEKSVILIDGASGTGKTAIAKYIASEIDIPCVKKSVTVFSKVGYEGESLTGMLVDLVSKAHGDLKKAEHGIVIIDEIGTVATKDPTQDRMKREIQNELLDFLGGGKYDIYYQNQKMEFDTSTLTFIGLASFTELRKQKIKEAMENYQYTDADAKISFVYQDTGNVVPFGFKVDLEEPTEETIEYDITKEDLVNYGYQDDLINRFNTFIHTKDYDKETLKHIITHSSTSPFLGLKEWIKLYGKKPIVEEETIDLIAEKAYELHSGARGIETVIEAIKDRILESTMLGNNKNIYITSELVEAACKGISHHEGRRRS